MADKTYLKDRDKLETEFVDARSLSTTLEMLSEICQEKKVSVNPALRGANREP